MKKSLFLLSQKNADISNFIRCSRLIISETYMRGYPQLSFFLRSTFPYGANLAKNFVFIRSLSISIAVNELSQPSSKVCCHQFCYLPPISYCAIALGQFPR